MRPREWRRAGGLWMPGVMALMVALMVGAGPLGAQTASPPADTDPDLRALIPDAAVSRPEDWAKTPAAPAPQPAPAPAQPAPPPPAPADMGAAPVGPESPLRDIEGLNLVWPDFSAGNPSIELPALPPAAAGDVLPPPPPDSLLAEAPARKTPSGASDTRDRMASGRLLVAWDGPAPPPERAELEQRFRAISTIQNLAAKERDNIAQLGVRAASDRALLERLLRIYGYYDAEVTQTLATPLDAAQPTREAGGPAAPLVRFDVVPGARYRFGAVDLPGLAGAGADAQPLRKSFAINPGDPLYADTITAQAARLGTALGESGYAFAKVGAPALTVDHLREEGDLSLPVTPAGKYVFGPITSGNQRFLSSRHLARIARFKPGQLFKQSQLEDLRRAILATGLVSSLTVTPRPADAAGDAAAPTTATAPRPVAIDVAMTPAPPRTVSAAVGYDTSEGYRLELNWAHRNLFPPEGALSFRGVAGTNEQLAGATFRRNNFQGRDRVLTVDLYAQNANLTAYAARKVAFLATYERQTTLIFQKPWSWSIGAEAEASDEREGEPSGTPLNGAVAQLARTMYVTGAVPLRATYDGTNSLLDPTRGWRASLRFSPEMAFSDNNTHSYAQIEANISGYLPLAPGVVAAARSRIGSIIGTGLNNIAPSRRFYAGGAGSVRGFGYDLVGPRDAAGQLIGGRAVYEVSGEMRFHTGLLAGALSVAPFLDAGGAETYATPDFKAMRFGAGVGLRYASGIGPIRLDIGTPLDPRPGESRVGIYISLGQAF